MNPSVLPGRRALVLLLVLAPLLELVEAATSPLHDGSTYSELGHIAAHQTAFVLSTACGLVATLLYLPMFLGLAESCRPASPRLARFTAWVAAFSMMSFVGIRMVSAVQLQAVRDGLDRRDTAALLDHLGRVPTAAALLVLFLGGALVGLVCLGVLVWRAGLPRPAAVLLVAFQPIDLVPSRAATLLSHALLFVALAWIAVAIGRRPGASAPAGNRVAVAVPAP